VKLHLKKNAKITWCGKDQRKVSLGVDKFYGRDTCKTCINNEWHANRTSR
jgi:hypothetical protein